MLIPYGYLFLVHYVSWDLVWVAPSDVSHKSKMKSNQVYWLIWGFSLNMPFEKNRIVEFHSIIYVLLISLIDNTVSVQIQNLNQPVTKVISKFRLLVKAYSISHLFASLAIHLLLTIEANLAKAQTWKVKHDSCPNFKPKVKFDEKSNSNEQVKFDSVTCFNASASLKLVTFSNSIKRLSQRKDQMCPTIKCCQINQLAISSS